MENLLSESQLRRLADVLHLGAERASAAMVTWLSTPSMVEIDSLEQLPVMEAAEVLGEADQIVCFCTMAVNGAMTGQLILAFDDRSGRSLVDLLMDRPTGTAIQWDELEQSAALETTNIIGCAYLNSLSQHLGPADADPLELLPSPPTFRRDFAASLLQSAFLEQAMTSDDIIVARATFQIRGETLNWTMLFVPDAVSITRLQEWLEPAP